MAVKILIVDDDPDIRFTLTEGLNTISPEYEIDEAENGKKALVKLKSDNFDIVIIDIMMPVMDGWELSSIIKGDPNLNSIPLLFLSAKTDEYSKTLGRMSAEEYIEKPFEIIDIKERIDKIVRR